MLFEVWEFRDPLLVITTHRFQEQPAGQWRVRSAQTREFMLTSRQLVQAVRKAGFVKMEKLDHPYEAAYRLWA